MNMEGLLPKAGWVTSSSASRPGSVKVDFIEDGRIVFTFYFTLDELNQFYEYAKDSATKYLD